VDISKEDLELGEEMLKLAQTGYSLFECLHDVYQSVSEFVSTGDEEEENKETKQEFTLLCDWVKQQLGDKVAKVQISKRLSSSPCVLVSGKFGWSANMER
jgi:HSP90 family molecular chaperone